MSELLARRCEQDPDFPAFAFLNDGETVSAELTFRQLDTRARPVAASLRGHAVQGDRALLLYPPGLDFIQAFWGCLYAGIVAVPLFPPRRNRNDRRIGDVAEDAEAVLALGTSDVLANARENIALPSSVKWLATDGLDSVEAYCDDTVTGETLAFLQYTSGSTSSPKGVMVSHANLLENLNDLDAGWRHTRDSVMVTWLPTFHDMGLIYGVLQPVFNGFRCYAMPPAAFFQRPLRWLHALTRFRGTHSAAPNFAYDHCVDTIPPEQRDQLDLSCWRVALNGAEPVRLETQQRFVNAFSPCGFRAETFSPGYGLAEATLKATATHIDAPVATCCVESAALAEHQVVVASPAPEGTRTLVGNGPPSGCTEIAIVDPETHMRCPSRRVGEIWIAGPTVARGYWNRPQETRETFQAKIADTREGPFLRTGDLGFVYQGDLFVTGRIKDLIILQGANVYPQDIEQTVEQCHDALRPSCGAAFGIELDGHERLVVVQEVERAHLRSLDPEVVIGAIRQAVLDTHMVNLHAVVLLRPASVLKTSSGKIQRSACRKAFMEDELKVVAHWQATAEGKASSPLVARLQALAPAERQSELVSYLRDLLAEHVNCGPEEITLRAPLVKLGIESTSAVEISIQLQEDLAAPLASTVVYDYPTLETMAAFLEETLFPTAAEAVSQDLSRDKPTASLDDLSVAEIADLLSDEIGRN